MVLKLVQLGLGGWGRSWAEEVVRKDPDIELVAWVDLDAASRATAIAELDLPPERVFGSLAEVPRSLGAQAALVVVPLAAHAAATRACLEAGLHVLVEKPFTETLAEAAELVALAEAGQRKLMVSQNYRWFPAPAWRGSWWRSRRSGRPWAATSTSTSCSTRATATSSWPNRCSATWRSTTSTPCASSLTTSRSR